jgi:hypothetical protein
MRESHAYDHHFDNRRLTLIIHHDSCKKYDFSATARGREGYDPDGPEAFP